MILLAEIALANGGTISFEWPRHCTGWLLKALIDLIIHRDLFIVDVDGCACGMTDHSGHPVLKQWRFVTSNPRQAEALSKLRCQHERGLVHAEISGSLTKSTERYPPKLAHALLYSLYPGALHAPAMLVHPQHPSAGEEPREHTYTSIDFSAPPAMEPVGFAWDDSELPSSFWSTPSNTVCCAVTLAGRDSFAVTAPSAGASCVCFNSPSHVFACVTHLLDRNQTNRDPKAILAVQTQCDALVSAGTWDLSTVTEKADLISHHRGKDKIHLGE